MRTMEELHVFLKGCQLPQGVITVEIRSEISVHMWPDEFLAEFSEYDCEDGGSSRYPYELSARRDGIKYFVVVEELPAGKSVAETERAES